MNVPVQQSKHLRLPDSLPGLDIADAMDRLVGNVGLFLSLLKMISDDYPKYLSSLSVAFSSGDFELAAREAHTIKGVAGNLSMVDIYNLAIQLELMLKEGRTEHIEDQLSILRNKFEEIVSSVLILEVLNKKIEADSQMVGHPSENTTDLNSKNLRQYLIKLDGLLSVNDMKAKKLATEVVTYLSNTDTSDYFEELKSHVDALDFVPARLSLKKIAHQQGINMEVSVVE